MFVIIIINAPAPIQAARGELLQASGVVHFLKETRLAEGDKSVSMTYSASSLVIIQQAVWGDVQVIVFCE